MGKTSGHNAVVSGLGRTAPCCPISWHSQRVALIRFRGDRSCHTSTRRDQFQSTSVVRNCARRPRQVIEMNPPHSPCRTKTSAVESLALRYAIGRTRTLLRWCYYEANVDDALTKLLNRAHDLLRKFLQSPVWRIVWDPDFINSKKLKQQKKVKRSKSS